MSELKDREVIREPLDPAEGVREVEEAFQFNNAPTEKQILKCDHLEHYARGFAIEIAAIVPPGKFQTVAVNNVLGALMWARHGVLAEREVQLGTTHRPDCAIFTGTPERPEPCSCGAFKPVPCCERDTNRDGNCDIHKA